MTVSETKSLAAALAAFQAELPRVTKTNTANTGTYSYDYADLADVSSAVLPLLAKHGLSFSSKPTIDDQGRFVLAYALRHVSGESDCGSYPLPTGNPQQVGSAITYARRYALSAVTGVAPDKDDDGQAAKDTRVTPRVEKTWDPIEQETYFAGYQAEIEDAKTDDEITEIGARVGRSARAGELSPATVAKLKVAAGKRKGELNGGES